MCDEIIFNINFFLLLSSSLSICYISSLSEWCMSVIKMSGAVKSYYPY